MALKSPVHRQSAACLIRRRVRRVLILTPASLSQQWQREMKTKFALNFDLIDRAETHALQRRIGLDANPWRTYPRRLRCQIMTAGQTMALEQLREVEAAPDSPLEIISFAELRNGRLAVDISVDCSTILQNVDGMPLRSRERLKIYIPPDFPFSHPQLYSAHRRWENYPHVYWATYLCLYQAPDTEWNPSDGMFGFVARIEVFLRDAALGKLDPVGAPLHPPTTPDAGRYDLPTIIPQVNAPTVADQPWFGFALIQEISERRIDITGCQAPMRRPRSAPA